MPRQSADEPLELIDDGRNDQQPDKADHEYRTEQRGDQPEPACQTQSDGQEIRDRGQVDGEERRDEQQEEDLGDAVDEQKDEDDEYSRRQNAVGLARSEDPRSVSQLLPPPPPLPR